MFFDAPPSRSFVLPLVFLGLVAFAWWRWRRLRPEAVSSQLHRGRSLRHVKTVQTALSKEKHSLQLGTVRMPLRIATGHLAFVGATGSGKTVLQRLLMQSTLPRVREGSNHRALIYDAKQDILPILAGMDLRCPVRTFNPFDARGVAWDLAADITSPASALQMATLLMPKAQSDANPFFSNAARHLLYGVLLALIQVAPGRWTLRHLLLIVRTRSLLVDLLRQTETTQHLLQYFDHEATFQNILSTILTRTAPFEIIAATWDQRSERISLKHWLAEESVLVLGNDEENRTALDTMNQLLFKRLSELLLAQTEVLNSGDRLTWVILDEVRQAGKLDGLSALMTKGRSKGAAIVLGFQDIHGVQAVYGKEVAEELVGQCNTKAILRVNSPDTARWASKVIGTSEFLETHHSVSQSHSFRQAGLRSDNSMGRSASNGITQRDLVLASELLDLPETSIERGLTGYFINPVSGVFRDSISGDWLRAHLLPCDPNVPNFIPRPDSAQYLRPWTSDDTQLLGTSRAGATPLPLSATRSRVSNL